MSGVVPLDSAAVLAALKARAAQTYMELLDEVARLTAYAQALESQLAERTDRTARGDAWTEQPDD